MRSAIRRAAEKQNAGARRDADEPATRLLSSNRRAWDVFMTAYRGRQFIFAGFGEVVGFNYEAVLKLIEFMVPAERRREVFWKFQIIEPFALAALRRAATGGSDGAGSDSKAGRKGRRERRPRTRS